MSEWIGYDEFVDLVRNHHHDGFSGLVTGVSDLQHSFQIGFDKGEIVLLSYRISKGAEALEGLSRIERARVSEHPAVEIQGSDNVPDTSTILSQLTSGTLDDTTSITEIDDVPQPSPGREEAVLDARLRVIIETAAIHHFGPIGAMVCDEKLAVAEGDLRAVILAIAQEIGASEADTRAFFQSVSGNSS